MSPSRKMPICRAMAVAVTLWSPVIMMVRMPPASGVGHRLSGFLPGRTIMEMRPMKVKSCSSSRDSGRSWSSSRRAKASTRRPFSGQMPVGVRKCAAHPPR